MNNKLSAIIIATSIFLCCWQGVAEAANQSFTATQTNPTSPSVFDMSSTPTITYTIKNTSGVTDRIWQVTFSLPGGGYKFLSAFSVPTGWTLSSKSTSTKYIFQANSWSYAIAPNNQLDFGLVILMAIANKDTTKTAKPKYNGVFAKLLTVIL